MARKATKKTETKKDNRPRLWIDFDSVDEIEKVKQAAGPDMKLGRWLRRVVLESIAAKEKVA